MAARRWCCAIRVSPSGHAYLKQDWVHGCRTLACNPIQFLYGIAGAEPVPEITIGWSFADYAAGRDTVMDRVR